MGVEEKGVISKGTGTCSALSLATGLKKKLKVLLKCHFVMLLKSMTALFFYHLG